MKYVLFLFAFLSLSFAHAISVEFNSTDVRMEAVTRSDGCHFRLLVNGELITNKVSRSSCSRSAKFIDLKINELKLAQKAGKKIAITSDHDSLFTVTANSNATDNKKKLECAYTENSELSKSCSGRNVFINKVKCTDSIGHTFESLVTCEGKTLPDAKDCLTQNHLLQKSGALAAANKTKGAQ